MEYIGEVAWWHWVLFGLVLLIVELASMTFLFAGFAVAAFIVAAVTASVAVPFWMQLALWSLLSVGVFIKWRNHEARNKPSDIGQSTMGLNVRGNVTEAVAPGGKGKVRFDAPVLGASEWTVTSDEALDVGTRVRIVEIRGQLITVAKER